MLNADNVADRVHQYHLLEAVVGQINAGEQLDRDAFELLVEDTLTAPAVSPRKAARLLTQTGVFSFQDGCWQFCENTSVPGVPLTWERLCSLFEVQAKQDTASPPSGHSDVTEAAIHKAIGWMIDMTLEAVHSGEIAGLPAFYTCGTDGDHPIGFNVAGTATSDALTMLCSGLDYLPGCGRSPEDVSLCVSFLAEKTLACQCVRPGWDCGGFYPLEDQPDASHPTVEATCLAVMALCAFFQQRSRLEQFTGGGFSVTDTQVMQAVLDGLEFLMRMQQEDGSFGIYTYEDGRAGQSNDNCTRIALSTMGVCKGSGIFDRLERFDLYPACSDVIARAYHCLTTHTAESTTGSVWAPFFGTHTRSYRPEDILVSTARVCRAWIPVWWQEENERPQLVQYCKNLIEYWNANYVNASGIGFYSFTTPTNDSFSTGEYRWASHPHMLTAFTILQAYNQFDLPLTKHQWALIEQTVQDTLAMQHPQHGHWDNPMSKGTPFCAVTLAAIELLQEYRIAKGLTKE